MENEISQSHKDSFNTQSKSSVNIEDISHPALDGLSKIINLSVMPILINEVEDVSKVDKSTDESVNNVPYDDPICKLGTLIQSFKDSFISEKSHNNNNENVEISSESDFKKDGLSECLRKIENEPTVFDSESNNSFENGKGVLTKNESEGYILEHKSITSFKSIDTLELTQNYYTFQNVFQPLDKNTNKIELVGENGEHALLDVYVEDDKVDYVNSKDINTELVNPFEILCELFDFFEDESKPILDHLSLEATLFKDAITVKSFERVFTGEGDIVDIHEAIRRGDECLVRQLLASGADPDELDWREKGDPPIVQAALRQNVSIVRALCLAGCDKNLATVRGETALHMAVSRRPVSLPLLDLLLSAGCNPDTQDKLRGCTALHCVSGFADYEPQAFLKLVNITNVNLQDHRHSTVLHRIAATSNDVKWIKKLLELGANPSVQNDRGETALCVALERGWEVGALALVAGGTDLSSTNLYRETALHVAARHNQATVVAALLHHGAEVNMQDLAGNTALHLAAGRGYGYTVMQLLTCPHLDLDTQNYDHATPLTCAVESGFISVVEMLVGAEEVDLKRALNVAKESYRRRSQPEMCALLSKELARRQKPHLT